jgi:hypothetical protein
MKPDIELVRKWFAYDPETGVLSRKLTRRSNGSLWLNPDAHRVLFMGTQYQVTHIIWVIYHGKWPDNFIDHINHDRKDRRIVNLREADYNQNCWNRLERNMNGKGVYHGGDSTLRPWKAQIQVNNKYVYLGRYETKEEAHQAYREAALKYHGEFACLD